MKAAALMKTTEATAPLNHRHLQVRPSETVSSAASSKYPKASLKVSDSPREQRREDEDGEDEQEEGRHGDP